MTGLADLNLVLARIIQGDALHGRARAHLQDHPTLRMPFSVGIELLFVCRRFDLHHVEALGAAQAHFEVENPEVLYAAAHALDEGEVPTVFDAVHLAEAHHRGTALHTADERLQGSSFPTTPF